MSSNRWTIGPCLALGMIAVSIAHADCPLASSYWKGCVDQSFANQANWRQQSTATCDGCPCASNCCCVPGSTNRIFMLADGAIAFSSDVTTNGATIGQTSGTPAVKAAFILAPHTYTMQSNLVVNRNDVLSVMGGTININASSNINGSLELLDDASLSAVNILVPQSSGAPISAILRVDGGSLTTSGEMRVATVAPGSLRLDAGATANLAALIIGQAQSLTGNMHVDDGSQCTVTGAFRIGSPGSGHLWVEGAGATLHIPNQPAQLGVTDTITSSGDLTIRLGGVVVIDTELQMATGHATASSSSEVQVNGANSSLTVAGPIRMTPARGSPPLARATLQCEAGGVVNATDIIGGVGYSCLIGGTFNANVVNVMLVRPGEGLSGEGIATLEINGNCSHNPAGQVTIELAGLLDHDRISVAGHVSLAGTLRVKPSHGFYAQVGDTFTILNAGSISGTFSAVEGPGDYQVNYSPNAVSITTLVPPTPGDINGDDVVDVDDLIAVLSSWAPGACIPDISCFGDVNGDGRVDVDDLIAVILNWG